MKAELHPYGEYLSSTPEKLIIGSFPIGKFTDRSRWHEIKEHEIDFYYGGEGNQLWKLLSKVFQVDLSSREKIIAFIERENISLADVIKSCSRHGGRANDADLHNIEWNTGLRDFIERNHFKKIYFTSKKVYHWFEQHIGLPESAVGKCELIFLLSPSANGVRPIPRMKEYREWKKTHGDISPSEYRELMYKKSFMKGHK